MKKITFLVVSVFFLSQTFNATAQYITALDNAGNYDSWTNGSNAGFGFENWALWTEGTAGHFIGSSFGQGFGDIDTGNKSFGMWGNPPATPPSSNFSHAQRQVSFWADGATFSADIAIAFRNGDKGIDLWGPGFELLWNFNVANDQYIAGGISQGWSYSQTSIFKLSVTQNGSNLDISLERGTDSYTITIINKTLYAFKFYVGNTEAGNDLNNLFFNNLKVEYSDPSKVPSTANVTINGNVELAKDQALTVSNLTIPAGSSLMIKSDSDATGSLIVNGTVSGNVTSERYIAGFTSPTSGWHFLSSPVSAQPISDFHTAGSGSDFYKWNEQTGEWTNRTATGGGLNGSFETNFTVGTGYLIANNTTSTKEFSGALNVSDVPVTGLTNTETSTHKGWHLLGNPFSSAIKFDQGAWAKTNVGNFAQIWNESAASYKVLAGSQIIPAHNGFMVYTTGSGSLTIPADARLHSDSAWYKNTNPENEIVLIARDPEGQTAQETIISFNPDATEGFDLQYDSYFLSGFAPMFYSVSQNQLFALNALPSMTGNLEIPLGFVKNESSNFTIELVQTINDQTIYLIDQKTEITHKLSDSPYHFIAESGDAANRFLLKFSAVGMDEPAIAPAINAWVNNNMLYTNTLNSPTLVEVFDLTGRAVYITRVTGNGLQSVNLSQPAGLYLIRLSNGDAVHTIKATIQ